MEFLSPLLKDERVRNTLSDVENLEIPHPGGVLLSEFIEQALDPIAAATYVDSRLSDDGNQNALALLSDWIYIVESVSKGRTFPSRPDKEARRQITERDGYKCCITGRRGSVFDPLCVVPILPLPVGWLTERETIFEMLGVFFGPSYRDWWLSYIRNPRLLTPYDNHWLVRRSAAKAFAEGSVCLLRRQGSMIQFRVDFTRVGYKEQIHVDGTLPILGDHSRRGLTTADARLIGTHARMASSFQFLTIASRIAPEILGEPPLSLVSPALHAPQVNNGLAPQGVSMRSIFRLPITAFGSIFHKLWLWMPNAVRLAAYRLLQRMGRALYGSPDGYASVQRLPFGLYLKYNRELDSVRNEFNALRLVRQHTTIPVPKPLDVVTAPTTDSNVDEADPFLPSFCLNSYLLTTRMPGVPLSTCNDLLSGRDLERIAAQLKHYITQLRTIPNTVNKKAPICDTLGGPCRDARIRGGDSVGPFADEAAFSQMLRIPDEPSRRGHEIMFSHADLNPRNILVEEHVQPDGSVTWNVSGFVDWEFSGYFPEYWEYTKALFEGFRWPKRYNNMIHSVFKEFGDYSKELDIETRCWEMGDGRS
ncbi:hypothetical protein GGS20DRAFT_589166 [Poronia punctata]|nr:hypothetical protein GGS20DRAFT_589166 [Poronia punctata]